MISVLRIKNLALADNTTVELGAGLNVITGETGAGKSMLIGALGLLLGNRADKGMIRTGEEACGAEAVFALKDTDDLNELLVECGAEPCVDGELVIRRVVRAEGAGQNWVNGSPVALQVLKRIGDLLVDIHGPHDHQSLLIPESQQDIVDSYGHLWKEREAYESFYDRLRETDRQIGELSGDERELAAQIDNLSYRVKEIREAEIREEEEEELLQEHMLLGHAQRIQELGGEIIGALTENEPSAFDQLTAARQALHHLEPILPEASDWLNELDAVIHQTQELNMSMSRRFSDIEHNPERLAWLDERLALYQRLKRKYGPSVAEVLETYRTDAERLELLESRGEQLGLLEKEREEIMKRLRAAAADLTKNRKTAAAKMSKTIEKELQALGLKHGAFSVRFDAAEPRPSGMDLLEFEFAPNAGEQKQALRLIASSGEMSRVMLAIKTVLAAHDRIPVLVFDEIDSNVGGETAKAVGSKLAEVATNHQVLCITHFPQVAVFGSHHLAVEKVEREGRTYSTARKLTEEDRVEEIARMLGGRDLTSMTLDHAREMLATAAIRRT